EAGEDAILRRVGLEHIVTAVVQLADHLEDHARPIFLLRRRHPGEGDAVMPHRLVAGCPFALAGVEQDELALLGVAALPVAGQALADTALGPTLILKVVIHGRGAPRDGPWHRLGATNGDGADAYGYQGQDSKPKNLDHEQESHAKTPRRQVVLCPFAPWRL